ncbi:MAG: carboxypeptidase-like regulatory domain-containing protein, partial [Nitrospirota bacterium]
YADGYPKFVDNTFVRQDAHASYRTIRSQNAAVVSTGDFIANRFENGASMSIIEMEFWGSGKKEIKAGWHLDVIVRDASGAGLSGASVVVKTNAGVVVFNGTTNGNGTVRTDVAQYVKTNVSGGTVVRKEAAVTRTPHTVVVTRNGKTVTRTVTITGNQALNIIL